MSPLVPKSGEDLLPATPVRARYGVSDMTIFRWLADPKLGFPQPIRINGRRYWRLADLQAFEARLAEKEAA
ncbi:DNA-binding protein [Methylobacterium sp. J-048]|uniref:helix-turn-helix transcriptional regulator n=1 Tax=Methylobacterium sp. J-048 TaxID=2836635 RepID=UPI001FBABFA3|nr:DNA-binding protein [Methylobacterium sp. J-048]MCJ2058447.1 DNA-binding protein [Methylobacterium sp. J-048]